MCSNQYTTFDDVIHTEVKIGRCLQTNYFCLIRLFGCHRLFIISYFITIHMFRHLVLREAPDMTPLQTNIEQIYYLV